MALGAGLTAWSYMWRITPVHREEGDGSPDEDRPPPLGPGVAHDGVQLIEDGHGPLLHRTYRGVVRDAGLGPGELIEHVSADPNRVVPLALARFHKTRGEPWRMRVGDEFLIRMPGPWDGPVRAVELTPASFRFATLDGHLEAGQIQWSAFEEDGHLVFEVDSRSRGGDPFSAFFHDRIPMAK